MTATHPIDERATLEDRIWDAINRSPSTIISLTKRDAHLVLTALASARRENEELKAKLADAHDSIAWFKEGKIPSRARATETG